MASAPPTADGDGNGCQSYQIALVVFHHVIVEARSSHGHRGQVLSPFHLHLQGVQVYYLFRHFNLFAVAKSLVGLDKKGLGHGRCEDVFRLNVKGHHVRSAKLGQKQANHLNAVVQLKALAGGFLFFQFHSEQVVACGYSGIHKLFGEAVHFVQLLFCCIQCGNVSTERHQLPIVVVYVLYHVLFRHLKFQMPYFALQLGHLVGVDYLSAHIEGLQGC